MGMIKDMEQDSRIEELTRRTGGRESRVLQKLIGQECTMQLDFSDVRCRVIDVDADWIMLTIYGKKANEVVIRRISDVGRIKLDKELI
ncbi:MAG: hypothetical protein IJ806_09735 [Ruminococcus sp.]|nr:hypothetical protein [Ruminococcus sp.]